ncbi:MAG: hypothetical protein AAGA03_00720 [Planctomycetota bacterium]
MNPYAPPNMDDLEVSPSGRATRIEVVQANLAAIAINASVLTGVATVFAFPFMMDVVARSNASWGALALSALIAGATAALLSIPCYLLAGVLAGTPFWALYGPAIERHGPENQRPVIQKSARSFGLLVSTICILPTVTAMQPDLLLLGISVCILCTWLQPYWVTRFIAGSRGQSPSRTPVD